MLVIQEIQNNNRVPTFRKLAQKHDQLTNVFYDTPLGLVEDDVKTLANLVRTGESLYGYGPTDASHVSSQVNPQLMVLVGYQPTSPPHSIS